MASRSAYEMSPRDDLPVSDGPDEEEMGGGDRTGAVAGDRAGALAEVAAPARRARIIWSPFLMEIVKSDSNVVGAAASVSIAFGGNPTRTNKSIDCQTPSLCQHKHWTFDSLSCSEIGTSVELRIAACKSAKVVESWMGKVATP